MLRLVLLLVPVFGASPAPADEDTTSVAVGIERPAARAAADADALFPAGGRFAGTLISGIPYLGIAEVAYGVTDRFAIGVLGGVTPDTYGLGLRLRGVVADFGSSRLVLGSPLLFYPATSGKGNEPWVLALPTLRFETMISGRVRLQASAGVAVAACIGMIGSLFGGSHEHKDGDGFVGGVWEVWGGGAAWQVGSTTVLFADALLVTKGLSIAHNGWIGGPPVIVYLGVQQAF